MTMLQPPTRPRPANSFRLAAVFACLALLLSPVAAPPALADHTPEPEMVAIPGTLQSELGCSGDWMPSCEATFLAFDEEDGVWQGTFPVEPGDDQDARGPRYKVAINGGWGENYGLNAQQNGPDIPLVVAAPTEVKFYYDHNTHWVVDNLNTAIIVAMGDFQQQLGCAAAPDPGCLRSWLQDPDGDQVFGFSTRNLKAGAYSVTLTLSEDAAMQIGEPQEFTVERDNDEIYIGYNAVTGNVVVSTSGAPVGNLSKLRGQWISRDTLLWDVSGSHSLEYTLVYSPEAALELTPEGVSNGTEIPLIREAPRPDIEILRPYPYLRDFAVFKLAESDPARLRDIVKGQVAVVARDGNGRVVDAKGVQLPGVLDDLFKYDGPLGATYDGDAPTLRVWAPTAQSVTLHLFDGAQAAYARKLPMQPDPATGVWSIAGEADWTGKYYLYEVVVFVPSTGKIETNLVTDPYSLSLSTNSQRSQIVNLADPALQPAGWSTLAKPALAAPEDIVIYELHIRDFSVYDQTVPEALRGTFKAFTVPASDGMKHLAGLADAGLTHLHLLPAFDIASVNEDKSTWQTVDEAALAALPPDSDGQALAVGLLKESDGFNWGYDPHHYTVPEGSYATDPEGSTRIVEFREMVQALNHAGLRVVMDVVYNHTNASGQAEKSVLDRIVPGYYHRLNIDGNVEKSTCCENTATEHAMMRKLMIDSLVVWARHYKVDGFRFDLMGHHMLADMTAVRAALDALTLEADGVDGKSIYLYGEGWDFGEVANNARGKNATQLNIAGTGIGVFNDRLRDGLRGGNPFGDPREQGFSTGLGLTPNESEQRDLEDQRLRLYEYMDYIRLGLAGNLAEYEILRADGNTVPGRLIGYNQNAAGYTADPQENIVYASAHDNETLFDAIQFKAPESATLADRVRMNNLAIDVVMLSQGIPFFHAGDDLLRSKSLDRNSYNSGDWYNRLDFTYQSNNFGVGLPVEGQDRWDTMRPLLANPALKPGPAEIQFAADHFRIMLRVRKTTPLFRLQSADQIYRALTFLNTGPEQAPGLIVMQLADVDGLDPALERLVVLFNAGPDTVTFADGSFVGLAYEAFEPYVDGNADPALEAMQYDMTSGQFTIPARSTAIFAVAEAGGAAPTETPAGAATPAPEATAAPDAGAQTTVLNIVAVVVAAIGGLLGFLLWRRQAPAEKNDARGGKKPRR